jgi:hypothetical protein
MKRKLLAMLSLLAPVLVVALCLGWASRAQAARPLQAGAPILQSDEGLFTAAPFWGAAQSAPSPGVRRIRYVQVRFERLGLPQLGETAAESPMVPSPRVTLNLFDDTTLVALFDRVVHNETGSDSWVGHLEGIDLGFVILTVRGKLLVGNILYPGGVYEIYRVSDGIHAIAEIDQAVLPEDGDPAAGGVIPEPSDSAALAMTDDGKLIDVLVMYTDDAAQAVGGITQTEELINNAVETANQSYVNSRITQRLRLAATALVTYTETQNSDTDVQNLQAGSGGLAIAHQLRNAYAADLVAMIVNDLGGGTAGQAFTVTSVVSTSFASMAFVVVERDQAVNNLSFPHELGHLMGARHDWYADDTNNSPYTYNHGYVVTPTLANPWRTIMAYNNECDCSNETSPCPDLDHRTTPGRPWCTRLPYWSNPEVPTGTIRMGVAAGTSTACTWGNLANPECDADNHRTLNNMAYTVANFVPGNLSVVYVDTTCTKVGGKCVETGSSANPYDTFTEGVFRAAPHATVWIDAGNYPETLVLVGKTPRGLTISRPVTLGTSSGLVTIGQ